MKRESRVKIRSQISKIPDLLGGERTKWSSSLLRLVKYFKCAK
jgi:hypothetical protein